MKWHALVSLLLLGCNCSTLPEGPDGGTPGRDPGDLSGDGGTGDGGSDGGTADAGDTGPDGGDHASWALPPANVAFDYQLGGAYPPPQGEGVVVRDRNDPPAAALYSVCYVNGFQIQPGEVDFWREQEPELILRDTAGNPVIDEDWNEMLIDVGTPAKRSRVAAIVGGWMAGCADAGYEAVEIDNLDSFMRSRGLLTEEDAVQTMALFSAAAHANGMAIAQKNAAELVGRRAAMATDFVIAEECNRWSECGDYVDGYGTHVFVVEYRREDFDAGCRTFPQLSIVLRDLNLVKPGAGSYVYDGC